MFAVFWFIFRMKLMASHDCVQYTTLLLCEDNKSCNFPPFFLESKLFLWDEIMYIVNPEVPAKDMSWKHWQLQQLQTIFSLTQSSFTNKYTCIIYLVLSMLRSFKQKITLTCVSSAKSLVRQRWKHSKQTPGTGNIQTQLVPPGMLAPSSFLWIRSLAAAWGRFVPPQMTTATTFYCQDYKEEEGVTKKSNLGNSISLFKDGG